MARTLKLLKRSVVVLVVVAIVAATALVVIDWRARENDEVYIVEVPFVVPGSDAVTAGRIVFIHRDRADDADLLAHELVHVCQWEEQGLQFLWDYSTEYLENALEHGDLRDAYLEVSFERDARLGDVDCDLDHYLATDPAAE